MIAVKSAPAKMPNNGLEKEVISSMNAGSSRAHHFHTDEQNTQTGEDRTDVMCHWLFDKDDHCDTDECDQRCNGTDVQGNQLPGDRRTDVGTHDDPDCLL